jgi:hypothetical protein
MGSAYSATGQALGVRILQAVLKNMSDVEMKTPGSLKPGKEGDRFVKMQPAKNSHYIGITSKDKEINPVTIGGTWYPKRPSQGTATDVILHFHGGKFLRCRRAGWLYVRRVIKQLANCISQGLM